MKRSEFWHYRWIQDPQNPISRVGFDEVNNYILGKSNFTALPKGGITVASFLNEDKTKIFWVVLKCSMNENYSRPNARAKAVRRLNKNQFILTSNNYEYEVAKKIVAKLVELTQQYHFQLLKEDNYTKHELWKRLQNSFNIDSWVENEFKNKDTVINANVLVARGGTT